MKYIIWTIFLCPFFSACGPPEVIPANNTVNILADSSADGKQFYFPYQLAKPDATMELPGRLSEISGLSLSPDSLFLLAVNDEDGKIFFIDKENGKIKEEINFEKGGDYEGIEAAGDKIYVVKSNGTFYEISNPLTEAQQTKTLKTGLSPAYDIEGLGYDKAQNVLLLACKGKAGKGDDFTEKKAVYAFSLSDYKLSEIPVLLIDLKAIQRLTGTEENLTQKLIEIVTPDQAAGAFSPSGLAVHPLTGEVYIVATVGKLLVVLNQAGSILHVEKLNTDLFKQPEGICFDLDGTLFISTEGKSGKGKIFRFQSR